MFGGISSQQLPNSYQPKKEFQQETNHLDLYKNPTNPAGDRITSKTDDSQDKTVENMIQTFGQKMNEI